MQELSHKSIHELCELLVERTVTLLKAIDQKRTDNEEFRMLKAEVEKIQAFIKEREVQN